MSPRCCEKRISTDASSSMILERSSAGVCCGRKTLWSRSSRRRAGPSAPSRAVSIAANRSLSARKSESAVSSSTRRCSFSSFATTLRSHQAWHTSVVSGASSLSILSATAVAFGMQRPVYGCHGRRARPGATSNPGGESPECELHPIKELHRHGLRHPHRDRPRPHQGAHRARGGAARRAHAGLTRVLRQGAEEPRRWGRLVVPVARPVADLPVARQGRQRLGCRRQRVPRLPQRLRLDGAGARPSHDHAGGERADRARHALRRADRGCDRRRRGARAPLGPAEVALRQLRLRGDDGRDQDRAGRDRPRHDRQDLRLLPRPSRLRDGLDRGRVRQDRRPLRARVPPVRARDPAGRVGDDDRGARSTTPRRWSGGSSGSSRRAARPPA